LKGLGKMECKKVNKKMIIILAVAILSGCTAKHYRPVVDPQSCQGCNYEYDLRSCQMTAEENTNVGTHAVGGAAVGAGIFALLGAVAGVDAGTMAGLGAVVGGAQGAGGEAATSRAMVARCMAGRGYSVLR